MLKGCRIINSFFFIIFLHNCRFYLNSHLSRYLFCCWWSENDLTRDSKTVTRSKLWVLWFVATLVVRGKGGEGRANINKWFSMRVNKDQVFPVLILNSSNLSLLSFLFNHHFQCASLVTIPPQLQSNGWNEQMRTDTDTHTHSEKVCVSIYIMANNTETVPYQGPCACMPTPASSFGLVLHPRPDYIWPFCSSDKILPQTYICWDTADACDNLRTHSSTSH